MPVVFVCRNFDIGSLDGGANFYPETLSNPATRTLNLTAESNRENVTCVILLSLRYYVVWQSHWRSRHRSSKVS